MQDCRDREHTNYVSRNWSSQLVARYLTGWGQLCMYFGHLNIKDVSVIHMMWKQCKSLFPRSRRSQQIIPGKENLLRSHVEYPRYPQVNNKAALPVNMCQARAYSISRFPFYVPIDVLKNLKTNASWQGWHIVS